MIDTFDHPRVSELIKVHEHIGQGDCISQWATMVGTPNLVLTLKFSRPIEIAFAIEFGTPALRRPRGPSTHRAMSLLRTRRGW